jgi:hypothetical protein
MRVVTATPDCSGAQRRRRSVSQRLLLLCALALAWGIPPALAQPLATELSASLYPDAVSLEVDGSAQAVLLLRNDGETPIRLGALSIPTVGGVVLAPSPDPEGTELAVGESAAVTLSIERTAGVVPVSLPIVAHYSAETSEIAGVAVAGLTVEHLEGSDVASTLEVVITSSGAAVDEFHDGRVLVTIVNLGARSLVVRDVAVDAPAPLRIVGAGLTAAGEPIAGGLPLDLPPQRPVTAIFEVTIPPGSQLSSSSAIAQFFVTASLAGNDDAVATLSANHSVSLNVFGGSELAELLKIPSLLFLPGFLSLSMFLVWSRVRPLQRVSGKEIVDIYTAAVWVVLGSLAIGLAYGLLTGRDLRIGFAFRDLIWLSLVGVATGIAAQELLLALERRRDRARPTAGDDARAILQKLAHQKLDLQRPIAAAPDGADRLPWGTAFLYDDEAGWGKRAIGPAIRWRLKPSPSEDRGAAMADTELEQRVRKAIDTNNALGLIELDRTHRARLEIDWDPEADLAGIELKPVSAVAEGRRRRIMVEDDA